MKTIQIEVPEGHKASFDESTNVVSFEPLPKKVTERIKSFDDVLTELGITSAKFYAGCEGIDSDEIAYRQVKLIAQALNEGWFPDWSNGKWDKYRPYFNFNDPSAVGGFSYGGYDGAGSSSRVGSRLCYKSAELARYAGETFTEIYKQFMTH